MTEKISPSVRIFFSILFNIYLFFMVFDPMRESLDFGVLNTLISLLRDGLIFLLFIFTVFFVQGATNSKTLLVFLFSIIALVVLSFFTNENVVSILGLMYGVVKGLMLIFIIINLPKIYKYELIYLCKYFIVLTVFNYAVTLYIFFFKNYLIVNKNIVNRISVGNPSMQSIIFLCAFCLSLYFQFYNKIINFFLSLYLLIATVSTITSTAIVGVIAVFCITIFDKKYRMFWLVSLVIFSLFFIFAVNYFNINIKIFTGLFKAKWFELLNVVNGFLGKESVHKTEYNSMSLRDIQIERFWNNWKPISFIFGDGIFSMINQSKYMIENTYIALFRDFGFIGIANFLFFLLRYGIVGLKNYFSKKSYATLIAVVVIALYSYTLYIFAGTTMMAQLFLFFYLSCKMDEQRNSQENIK